MKGEFTVQYLRWLDEEKEWFKKNKEKKTIQYSVLALAACVVVLAAIGLLAGGGVVLMLKNAAIGLVAGCVVDLIIIILTGKKDLPDEYVENLRIEVDNLLTAEEKEQLAKQMEELTKCGDGGIFCWLDSGAAGRRLRISRDYALYTSERCNVTLIELRRVERIEVGEHMERYLGKDGEVVTSLKSGVYPAFFFYKDGKGKIHDVVIEFCKKSVRDDAVRLIQRMVG